MRCVILLRGVNVGGAGTRLPMEDFKSALEGLGCREVATYIQSGNAVCTSGMAADDLAGAVMNALILPDGTHPEAHVLTCAALADALAANPFPEAGEAPRTLHLFFLKDGAVVPEIAAPGPAGERAVRIGDVIYLHTPAGFGTSKLAGRLARGLGRAATARNLSTVRALAALCG